MGLSGSIVFGSPPNMRHHHQGIPQRRRGRLLLDLKLGFSEPACKACVRPVCQALDGGENKRGTVNGNGAL